MNRRSFFATLAAPFVARVLPTLPSWLYLRAPTVGGIDRATYAFWRNHHVGGECGVLTMEAMRQAFDACERGPQ